MIADNAFIGSIFGNGGGQEVRNSDFLAKLRAQLGARRGDGAFGDLMEAERPEAPTTSSRRFPYAQSGGSAHARARRSSTRARPSWRTAPPPRQSHRTSSPSTPQRSATRRSAGGDGPAARLLLPGDRARGRPARPRDPGPGRRSCRAAAPYVLIGRTPRLRLEPDHRAERQPRPVPRAALRAGRLRADPRLRPLPLQGRVPGDAHASTPAPLDGDRPRPLPDSPCTARCRARRRCTGKPYAIARQRSTHGRDAPRAGRAAAT